MKLYHVKAKSMCTIYIGTFALTKHYLCLKKVFKIFCILVLGRHSDVVFVIEKAFQISHSRTQCVIRTKTSKKTTIPDNRLQY